MGGVSLGELSGQYESEHRKNVPDSQITEWINGDGCNDEDAGRTNGCDGGRNREEKVHEDDHNRCRSGCVVGETGGKKITIEEPGDR